MSEATNEKPTQQKKEVCLRLSHIKKDYYVDKKPFTAIHDLSLSFPRRGFVAILGHSGSGKTTLLNIIGGLDHYTEGDMFIDGRSTKNYKDRDWDNYRNKRIGFIFQSYNLIPHLTVLQNVVLSLQLGGLGLKEREAKATEVLNRVGLGEYLKKRPNQLSGGQMQRVAIARALVNDPDIILADEPTGALDSATSVQVMDLIREVGQDRCVILVTHNRELADQYADRIIEMKDGRVAADTDPLEPEEEQPDTNPKGKRSAMSFWTALATSWRNIRTKKGRTALTAAACSIGIIGVALVLATSNGFSQYVSDVEVSIASSVPISITPIAYQIKIPNASDLPEQYPDEKVVKVYDSSNTLVTAAVYNDFTPEYIDYLNAIMDDPKSPAYGSAMSIMYTHEDIDFHFTAQYDDGEILSINQYASAGITGSAISTVTNLPSTVVHEIYGDEKGMKPLYDTIAGRFPVEADEMALVLDSYNRIDFSTMKKLGFFPSSTIFDVNNPKHTSIDFEDILYQSEEKPGKLKYKCYTHENYYQLPENPDDVYASLKTRHNDSYENISFSTSGTIGEDFSITASGDPATADTKYVSAPTPQEVFNNDEKYKPIKMKVVGILRPTESSYIQLMPTSLAYTPKLTEIMTSSIKEGTSAYELGQIQKENWFVPRSTNENLDGISLLNTTMRQVADILNTASSGDDNMMARAIQQFATGLPNCVEVTNILGGGNVRGVSKYLQYCGNLGTEFEKIEDLTNFFVNVIQDSGEGFFDPSMPDNVMDLLAYQNAYSLIKSILIFPASLTTKDTIHKYLDDWNDNHPNSNVVYSDLMQDFMGGLSTMIEVISAILIVFASISLVVSSVMTAIITYVSVIERTKEIGVLRACGGRKKDVSLLFEAECVIVGAFAGAIGIGFTLIACIPINAILDNLYPGNNLASIAQLNPWHAVLLLALSIALAFASGFVPSRMAANRDPVICLRSE